MGSKVTKTERVEAERAWKDFTKKSAIDFETTLTDPWPKSWVHVGEAKVTYYSSDKWKQKGDFEKYFHDHKRGVQIWIASDLAKSLGIDPVDVTKPPLKPRAAAVLGFSLGVDFVGSDGTKRKLMPDYGDDSLLLCSPDRKKLYITEGKKVVAVISGPSLAVEPRGIVG